MLQYWQHWSWLLWTHLMFCHIARLWVAGEGKRSFPSPMIARNSGLTFPRWGYLASRWWCAKGNVCCRILLIFVESEYFPGIDFQERDFIEYTPSLSVVNSTCTSSLNIALLLQIPQNLLYSTCTSSSNIALSLQIPQNLPQVLIFCIFLNLRTIASFWRTAGNNVYHWQKNVHLV
jgi:hypothetical protein